MAQLSFIYNVLIPNTERLTFSNGTISYVPFNIYDSISFLSLNFAFTNFNSTAKTITLSVGLYSLSGSTLSIANSISGSMSFATNEVLGDKYVGLTATSVAQNITPGTWWLGILGSTSSNGSLSFLAGQNFNPANSFPGNFIGGRMTDSTNALPGSYNITNLDTTSVDAMQVPFILFSS